MPTRLLDNVGDARLTEGGGQYATTSTGVLAYLTGDADARPPHPILWLDQAGATKPLVAQPGLYGAPRLSPDRTKLAYSSLGGKGGNVYVRDLLTDATRQLTFTAPGVREVAWAPDSKHLVFGDGRALWWIKADGSGQPHQILDKADNPRPFSISRDGRLVYSFLGVLSRPDIWILPLDLTDPERPKPGEAQHFLREGHAEVDPAFSPDGKFLAYASTEQGPNEVFVRSVTGQGKWRVSGPSGGKFPAWTARQLFYLDRDDRIMVLDYTIDGDSFSSFDARPWSPTQVLRDGVRQNFDIAADGSRAVIFPRPAQEPVEEPPRAEFLINFFDEIRRRIP